MSGWAHHQGIAVALPLENVDTDQIIPARYMSVPRSQGYGDYLFYDLRHDEEGNAIEAFPTHAHEQVSVLIARRNFGCGSSREAAVYALLDHGIKVVVAPSFGDIFAANAINNGLLPALVGEDAVEEIISDLGPGALPVSVDVAAGRITFGETELSFGLEDEKRNKLINGWDDIDLTRSESGAIAAFKQDYFQRSPWVLPIETKSFATEQ